MILSNEPGYYREDAYGIRIESLVQIIEVPKLKEFYGFETLTLVPLDLSLIDNSLLTDSEKTWIQDYHKKIYKTLAPLLTPSVKTWLKKIVQST